MTPTEARFVLGLSPIYTPDDLKRAYRKAAAEHHPDKGGNAERMVLVNEAVDVLSGGAAAAVDAREPAPEHQGTEPSESSSVRAPAPDTIWPRIFRNDHPLERRVRLAAAVLAAATFLTFVATARPNDPDFFFEFVFALPIYFFLYWYLVRFIVRVGIHVFNWVRSSTRRP